MSFQLSSSAFFWVLRIFYLLTASNGRDNTTTVVVAENRFSETTDSRLIVDE
jgi:hypothetical protein